MDNSKTYRILDIYTNLLEGKSFTTSELSSRYNVNKRSILRDISDLKIFISDKSVHDGVNYELVFDREIMAYRLENINVSKLTNDEILAVSKVLLGSRVFTKKKMISVITKLIDSCSTNENKQFVKSMVDNELYHYIEPFHKKDFLDNMWLISNAIQKSKYIEVEYFKMKDKNTITRKLKPLAIMFSEYYFYLIANIDFEDTSMDDMKPIIYRIDRIKSMNVLDKHFKIPYKDRFEEGIFRKRIQFMQGGELKKVKFIYRGESIESVIDRLPEAEIKQVKEDEFLVKATLYGRGIDMWLRSQGDRVEVV